MAIDIKAWEGYRVVWLRPESRRDGAEADLAWQAALENISRKEGRALAVVKFTPEHNDPQQFVQTVQQAVFQALDLPDATLRPQSASRYTDEWTDWINRISALGLPLALVLEDYGQIDSRVVHALLSELLEYQPESLQILLVCQGMPPLPLPRLRARRALLEVLV